MQNYERVGQRQHSPMHRPLLGGPDDACYHASTFKHTTGQRLRHALSTWGYLLVSVWSGHKQDCISVSVGLSLVRSQTGLHLCVCPVVESSIIQPGVSQGSARGQPALMQTQIHFTDMDLITFSTQYLVC